MDTSSVDFWTKRFFWCGFAVFLLASIPHLATYFRHFDPISSGVSFENIWYWGIAYLLAIVIDLSDMLVSIAVMKAMARGEKWYTLLPFWLFILFIMALSWFFNWQYNLVFGTQVFASADRVMLFDWFSVGQVNPVVGSAFQVLLLVYTGMAHKFSQKPKTIEELKAEANQLEERIALENRLAEITAGRRKVSLIQRAKETAKEVKEAAREVLLEGNARLQDEEVDSVTFPDAITAIEQGCNLVTLPESASGITVDTEEQEEEITPALSGNDEMSVHVVKPERNTDKLATVHKKRSSSGNKSKPKESETVRHIRKLIRQNSNIQPSEIARKVQVSRGYASRMKAQILAEIQQSA